MSLTNDLNKVFKIYQDNPGSDTLADVLTLVRKFALTVFKDEQDKDDYAQVCTVSVWRSIDPTVNEPLKAYDTEKASFATWLTIKCRSVGSKYRRDHIKQDVEFLTNTALEASGTTDRARVVGESFRCPTLDEQEDGIRGKIPS